MIVPHQANKTMVVSLAQEAGISTERLYFDIERVGNLSAASIPVAICDTVAEGVVDRPMVLFTPGFGAGAVAGYAVLRIDPAVVAWAAPTDEPVALEENETHDHHPRRRRGLRILSHPRSPWLRAGPRYRRTMLAGAIDQNLDDGST